jgi:hypothetical protein
VDRRLPGPLRIAGPVTQHVSADGYRCRRFPLQSASDTCPFTLAAHLILRPSRSPPSADGWKPRGARQAAFFFAVVVGHNSLRDEVKAPGFIYIESLYIVTYFVILGVALNSVLLPARPNLKPFRNYDNLWAKVLYWPVIWLTLLVVTIH